MAKSVSVKSIKVPTTKMSMPKAPTMTVAKPTPDAILPKVNTPKNVTNKTSTGGGAKGYLNTKNF